MAVDPDHPIACLLQPPNKSLDLSEDLGRVRGAGAQDELHLRVQTLGRAQQIRQTLLPCDAPDEDDRWSGRIDAERGEGLGILDRMPLLGVDAVVDDPDGRRIEVGVAAQDVGTHALAYRDDRRCPVVRGAFDLARDRVSAAELFGLPWAERLEAVCCDDVGDAVEQPCHVPSEVGVPRVGVHDSGACHIVDDEQVSPHRLYRRVRAPKLCRRDVRRRASFVAISAEGAHLNVERSGARRLARRKRAERLDQLCDVHTGAPIDLGRILLGDDVDAHVSNASTGSPGGIVWGYGYVAQDLWNRPRRWRG